MTKDGRPSRISDIRYFFGDKHTYLKNHEKAVAFGRRIAWFLNGEDFSLGAYPALYIFLTSSLPQGGIQVTDYGGDWWQRYTNVGVSEDFPAGTGADEIIVSGTVSALKTIRPECSSLVDYAEKMVRTHGDNLRFLIKSQQTRKFIVEVSFTIAVWPQPSLLFVSLTERSSGIFLEAPPTQMQFYTEAFDLAGLVKITNSDVDVLANKSVGAQLTASRHGGPLVRPLSDFARAARPLCSKIVRRR